MDATHHVPRIRREDEGEIAARARRHDPIAIEALVASHMPFVVHVAKEFRGRGVAMEDLVSEGSIGLLKAVRRFDPGAGTRFMTYASFWIRKGILQALHDQTRNVRVPRYAREQGFEPQREIHLDATVPGAGRLTVADRLADRRRKPACDVMIHHQESLRLRALIEELSPREKRVLSARFGLEGDTVRTLGEIGASMGLSRERVRQIESGALQRLRKQMRTPRAAPPRRQLGSTLRLEPSQT